MLKERFIEDLVWNEVHLGKAATRFLLKQNAIGASPDASLDSNRES